MDIDKILEHNDTRQNSENAKNNDRREIFQKIGQQEFEDVVFTPKRKQKKSRNEINENENIISSFSITDRLSSSLGTDHINANKTTTHSSLMQLSFDDDFILKTDRDLETIQLDVENKEKLLVDVLDFDLSKYMISSQMEKDDSNISSHVDSTMCISTHISCKIHTSDTIVGESDINEKNENIDQSVYTETELGEENVNYRTELKRLEDLGECRKCILQSKLDDTPSAGNNFVDVRQVPPLDRERFKH